MSRGKYRHLVRFQNPGANVPDGEGGFTQSWTDLTPATWYVSIEPASARDLERIAPNTVSSTASHIIKGDFHPQVTTKTRILFGARAFEVTGKQNVEERSIVMELVAVETVA